MDGAPAGPVARAVVILLVLAASWVALGHSDAVCSGEERGYADAVAPPRSYWTNPIDGAEVASPADADLPFAPDVPDLVGDLRIIVASPPSVRPELRQIAFVYGNPPDHGFFVREHVVPSSRQEVLASQAARCGCTTGQGRTECRFPGHSMVRLWLRRLDAQIVVQELTTITWVEPIPGPLDPGLASAIDEPMLEIELRTVTGSYERDQLVDLAERF